MYRVESIQRWPGLCSEKKAARNVIPKMLTLVARIGVEAGVGIRGTPLRIHCELRAHALLFSHFCGWLQDRHLVRGDRETPSLILWLLGSSRARST